MACLLIFTARISDTHLQPYQISKKDEDNCGLAPVVVQHTSYPVSARQENPSINRTRVKRGWLVLQDMSLRSFTFQNRL